VAVAEPKVTFALLTYRQAGWVREAVESVFAQDYTGPLEIFISDDASPDDTADVIETCLAELGPHPTAELRFVRRPTNLRFRHLPTLAAEATGDLIVVAHGDDLSVPDRLSRVVDLWKRTGAAWVGCNAMQIDSEGHAQGAYLPGNSVVKLGLDEMLGGWRGEMLGSTGAFARDLFDSERFIAPAAARLAGGWDHVLPFRAGLDGRGLVWTPAPLVLYRRHDAQNSRGINDWTLGRSVWEETLRAHSLVIQHHLRDELAHFRAGHPERHDLEPFTQKLDAKLLDEVAAWTNLRAGLVRDGLRSTWVNRSEYARLKQERK